MPAERSLAVTAALIRAIKGLPQFPPDGQIEIVEAGRGSFKAKLAFYSGIAGAFAGIGSFGADIIALIQKPDSDLGKCVAWTMIEDGVSKAGVRCEGTFEVLKSQVPEVQSLIDGGELNRDSDDGLFRQRPDASEGSEPILLTEDATVSPTSDDTLESIRFSRKWLSQMGLEKADLAAMRIEGDSMEPLLRSGDEIFVDRNKRGGEGVFVVRIGDALHVKQVRASAADTIALISANEAYAPLELPREEVEVIGRVVWKGGRV